MNRRDFFKNIAGAVGVAALGGVASQQAPTMSGEISITISNGIETAEPLIDVSELTLLPDPYELYDIGIQSSKGVATKITPIWSDELRVYEFFGEDGQIS